LKAAGNGDLTVRLIPGLDHGNSTVPNGKEWDFPRSSAEPDLMMVDWLKKRFG
jgi:hypothetical protein